MANTETAALGYNTIVKSGDKTFAGVTQDDLNLSAETKDSITKADTGTKRTSIVRMAGSITVAGICSTDTAATVLDREAIIDLALAKGTLSITYLVGSTSYTGSGYISGYKETTPADPDSDPTYSIDITLPNGLSKVTNG